MLAILLILIFIRPFISSLAFPYLNLVYSIILLGFLPVWLAVKGMPSKKFPSLIFPIILFILALFISVAFSYNKINSLKELYKYISAVLIFITAISLNYKQKSRVIEVIILAGLIISILAIYQYFFGFRRLLDYLTKNTIPSGFALDYINRKRVFFPFISPNVLAGYLAMIMPLALIHKNRAWIIIPLSFGILLAKSLGALLSLSLALGIYFYFLNADLRKSNADTRRFYSQNFLRFLFLIGLGVIIVAIFFIRSAAQKQHLQPIFSTVMRLHYWKDTLSVIKTKPLTGIGLGNFNLPESRYAHNSYLQIWAEMGVLGIISLIWLIIKVIATGLKGSKNSSYKNETACLMLANAVFLIHNLVDFTFFLPEINLIWWVIFGLLVTEKFSVRGAL